MALPRALLLALLAGNVLLRFFTNSLNVLPRIFNIWDVAVTFALAALALTFPRTPGAPLDTGKWLRRLLLFNAICVVGSLLNPKHVYPLAAMSQLVMWNEPILLFLAVVHLPFSFADIDRFRKLLLFLIGVEVAIGLLQVPIFLKTGASETIIGTFHGNAEQYQLFIVIGLFYLLAEFEIGSAGKIRRLATIFLILVLVVLIENKASWIALATTLVILLPKLPELRGHLSGKLKPYALVAAILFCGYQTVKLTSATYSNKFGNLTEAIRSGNLLNLGKVKAARDVLNAYASHPQMALVGSGLGTFYSRAAFQFFPFWVLDMYQSMPGAAIITPAGTAKDSASMAGIIQPVAGKDPFYRQFYSYEKIYPIGSGTADLPRSSYISLLGETGLLGTILYLGFYVLVFRKVREALKMISDDRVLFPFAAASFGCLIYLMLMGCYNFWLDAGRINTIVWAMLALVVRCAVMKAHAAQEIAESNSAAEEVCENFAASENSS